MAARNRPQRPVAHPQEAPARPEKARRQDSLQPKTTTCLNLSITYEQGIATLKGLMDGRLKRLDLEQSIYAAYRASEIPVQSKESWSE